MKLIKLDLSYRHQTLLERGGSAPLKLIVVDDIFTTGATLRRLMKHLPENATVHALCFAKTPQLKKD
jgi:predicted amidophosphoribosyltransferase